MKTKEDAAREILTERLLEDFKSEITGSHLDRVVEINPEDTFFVGKLMSINDEEGKNKVFSSKTFIESISVDFYVDETSIDDATVVIYPQGDFYYRVYPTLEEQRAAIIKNVYEMTNVKYASYDELLAAYKDDPKAFVNTEIKLIPVYRKISIHKSGYSMQVRLGDVIDKSMGFGYIDEKNEVNKSLTEYIDLLMSEIQLEEDFYRFVVNEKIKIDQLEKDDSIKSFVECYAKKDVKSKLEFIHRVDGKENKGSIFSLCEFS